MADRAPDARGAESAAMYRWQGGVDATLSEHSRRLDVINGDSKAARDASEETLVALAVLKTKVAVWSATGSLIGAGVVSGVIALLTKVAG